MLLALQSPGGPGAEVRRIMDRLIDQHWPRKERAVVKGFLQKISQPKYRSPDQMRKMVKKFTPARWFTQTVNLVRRELMAEMGLSSQYLTNVLGSKGRNIFKFLREKVGKNSSVKKIIDDLAEEIELLEPGASRVGTERRYELTEDQMPLDPHEAMIEWLRQMQNRRDDGDDDGEKEAGRHPHPDLLHDIFEKGEDLEWDAVTGPHQQYNRGPVELRVAQRYLFAAEVPSELQTQQFRNPDTGNTVLFKSLPPPEQQRILMRYQQQGQQEAQVPQQQAPSLADKARRRMAPTKESVKELGDKAFSAILETQDFPDLRKKVNNITESGGSPRALQTTLNTAVDTVVKLEAVSESPSFRKLPSKKQNKIKDALKDGHALIKSMTTYQADKGGGSSFGSETHVDWKPREEGAKLTWKQDWPKVQDAMKQFTDVDNARDFFDLKLPKGPDGDPSFSPADGDAKPVGKRRDEKWFNEKTKMVDGLLDDYQALQSQNKMRSGLVPKKQRKKNLETFKTLTDLKRSLESAADHAKKNPPQSQESKDWDQMVRDDKKKEEAEKRRDTDQKHQDFQDKADRKLLNMDPAQFKRMLKDAPRGDRDRIKKKRDDLAEKAKERDFENRRQWEQMDRSLADSKKKQGASTHVADLSNDPKFLQWAGEQTWLDPETKKNVPYLALSPKARDGAEKRYEESQDGARAPKKERTDSKVQGDKPGWRERLEDLAKQGTVEDASYEENKRMLYELTKAAFVHAELREDLAPLVRLGHSARVASRDLDLRGLVIRTAYVSTNLKLKRALLDAVVSSDRGHSKTAERGGSPSYRGAFMRWIAGRKFRNPDTGNDNVFVSLPDPEKARIYKEWQQGRLDWAQRHRPQGLGPETRITPQNLSQVRVGDVIWRSDSPVKLHRVTKVDKEGWRANAPTFTMVQFDRDNPDQTGEERHLPAAAVRNEMLEYHTVPNMGARADREQARAGLPQKPRGGWPKFQDVGLSDSKREKIQEAFKGMKDVRDPAEVSLKRIQVRLNDALGAHAPRKAVKEFMHELRDWAKQLTQAAAQGGPALRPQAKLWRAMQLKLDQGVSRLDDHDRRVRNTRGESKRRMTPDMDWMTDFMKAKFDAGARGTMKPIYARALLEMSVGASQMNAEGAKNLVKEFKDAGVDMEGTRATIAVGALSGFARHIGEREGMSPSEKRNLARGQADAGRQAKRMMRERRERDREQEQETQRRQEGPRRHQDRAQLRGGGRKQMSAKAKLPSYFIAKVLPVGASDEAKATAKAQLKKATYADLETLRAAAAWIDNNWDDERARTHPLVEHLGYDREGLKKLKKLLKRKLGDVNGRQYHDDVKNMANKYDLESEDADALYDFRIDKPARGRALSDQEKMSKFLAKAKPETRERMQGMSLADFMVMYKAILKEVLEDEEEVAEAA